MQTPFLTAAQKQNYLRDGFLVLNDFVSKNACDTLMKRASEVINENSSHEVKTIFSTADQQHAKHLYFLDSGDKIRCFFEEKAFDASGNLTRDKSQSINKIGHAMHDLDPVFNAFSRTEKLSRLMHDLEIVDPLLLQSMYICKQPHIGGEVTCHQDSTYVHVEEQPVTGLWFALEDATLENGCLWAIPGGHRTSLKSRMRRYGNEVTIDVYNNEPWPLGQMIPLEVPRGSLIILHGLLPHMSQENRSSRSRHAYTLHLMSAQHTFAADNWLQRPSDMPFRRL